MSLSIKQPSGTSSLTKQPIDTSLPIKQPSDTLNPPIGSKIIPLSIPLGGKPTHQPPKQKT